MWINLKHIFFDLDHTLWDFEQNSRNELTYLFSYHKLHQKGISLVDEFIKIYKKINNECWALYRVNKITKENLRVERFHKTLNYFGIEDIKLSEKRANAVRIYLIQKGVSVSRIESAGFGPNNPIADNETSEGKDKNRRVEFKVTFAGKK